MCKKPFIIESWIKQIKELGTVSLLISGGNILCLSKLSAVKAPVSENAVFLLYDLFQLRTIAKPFSEVSLDIVEWAEDPVIFHTDVNRLVMKDSFSGEIIKFAVLKDPFWKNSLRSIGEIVVCLPDLSEGKVWELPHPLPLFGKSVKQLYLSAEGQVKWI
ncbi:MAG: hypothetical protein JJU34_16330 [Lunatimonas sp.]|uniref:hypothetical protein n=1 Tax=Lunatimonas sp. TaxID=2060141 RepID=UPI00263B30BD|nr:hypothetical protein [Lunatimonas sp.]MCC5938848.1 hypothetical protein [Lunatimonas sp.]